MSVEKLVERYLRFRTRLQISHDREARLAFFRTDDHSAWGSSRRGQLELFTDTGVPEPVLNRDPALPHRMGKPQDPGHIFPAYRYQKGAELDRRLGSNPALLEELAGLAALGERVFTAQRRDFENGRGFLFPELGIPEHFLQHLSGHAFATIDDRMSGRELPFGQPATGE